MKRFILTTAALAFVAFLGATTNLQAAPHHAGGGSHAHASIAAHAHHTLIVHGHSVNVAVHVRGYAGWASRCWFPGYRTYGYYSGADQIWYYWYAPFNEYLPITYMSIYPPTAVVVTPVAVAPGTPIAAPMSPALPPGATLVPGPITAP